MEQRLSSLARLLLLPGSLFPADQPGSVAGSWQHREWQSGIPRWQSGICAVLARYEPLFLSWQSGRESPSTAGPAPLSLCLWLQPSALFLLTFVAQALPFPCEIRALCLRKSSRWRSLYSGRTETEFHFSTRLSSVALLFPLGWK